MKFDFDGELIGHDGSVISVWCEVQPPMVGGQNAMIRIAIPAQNITQIPPVNPCTLSGKSGSILIKMQEVHWRSFPTSSNSKLGLKVIELLHVERLTISRSSTATEREIRFHLAPISFLRSESSFTFFDKATRKNSLFRLDLPNLGITRFIVEWTTIYHRDAEIPGATVLAGFSAIVNLPLEGSTDIDQIVANFKKSLGVLSVLFRQAVTLHGWTFTEGQIVSVWNNPLKPNVTSSAHEDRGDFVVKPQVFVECAEQLTHAYEKANAKIQSLVRHLSLAVNPHNHLRSSDHFLSMFSALERVIEFAWKSDKTPNSSSNTTQIVIQHLKQLEEAVLKNGEDNAVEISKRLHGLIGVVNRPSVRDKFNAFLNVYPAMINCCSDLWPVLGTEKERGLKEIRNALAHGSSTIVSANIVAVAKWHLAILLERLIFVLLEMDLPEGIAPGSHLLRHGGKGWYERDWWFPLRSQLDKSILFRWTNEHGVKS